MKNTIYEQIKNAGKLPSPSGVALELLRLVEDDKATIGKITSTVSSDPAIASRLLKLVNSPLYRATRTIASVSMAVKLLGRHTVKNLAVGFSLVAANRTGSSKSFEFERFWSESLACAVAAYNLADHFKCCAADEAFTVALLSRIGRLALATVFPKDYDAVLEQVGTGSMPNLAEAEHKAFGIDHNHLTAEMMTDWRLSSVFCESVCLQDVVDRSGSDEDSQVTRVAGLLHLAGAVASVLTEPKICSEDLTDLLATADNFGFSADDFTDRFDSVKEEWRNVAAIFSIHSKTAPSLREVHTRASRRQKSILLVDNDPLILRLFGKYLADAGYQALTATNGIEALRLIHSEGCQVIITDWTMPEMDGLQLCQAIRESEGIEFAYIIMVTAKTDLDSLAQAFDAGADDFLTKPCKKQELLARLKAGIRALKSEEQLAAQRLSIHKTNAELATLNRKLHEIATTDELTDLYNRREAMSRLRDHWAAAHRQRRPLACMLLDIDHFKQFNDTYGHDVGDAVLRETAHILKRNARTGETVFRIGGEEFVVLCPGAAADMAAVGAERLRAAVEASQIRIGDTMLHVTISVGVAEKSNDTAKPDDLLKLADKMLYAAKHGGRNRVHTCGVGVPTAMQHAEIVLEKQRLPTATDSLCAQAAHRTVLIVDDDPSARRLFRKLLERDGFQVHEACDGADALSKMPDIHPHVILMDVEMPNMDGLECTRKLKADPTFLDVPIIMVSGRTDKKHVRAGLEAGAQEYITKPIVHDEFLLRVRAMSQLSQGKTELLQSNAVRGEQARAMGILFELSRSLAAADNLDSIVQHTVTATAELMNCRRVSVMLPDPTGKHLVVANAVGIDKELTAKILVPVGNGIAGKVFATGEPTVFNSQSEAANFTNRYESDFFASVPLASKALAVPNRVAGVLNVTERHGRRPFEPYEIEYLDLVCNMTASAIEQFQAKQAREHAHGAIVIGLAKLAEHRDFDTGKHLDRVTQYALLLARELRKSSRYSATIDDRFLENLQQSMPLHDIGKVSVADAILRKPGKLTTAEFAAMKRHTEVGALAIQSVIEQAPEACFLVMARDIAHCHHEKFDGSGYPQGLAGTDIPFAARIAAVADVYDALTTKRPYKEAFPHGKAFEIIRESSGSHFDPNVVNAIVSLQGQFANLAVQLTDQNDDQQEAQPVREFLTLSSGI